MQININPINNNQRPAFRAQKASQITMKLPPGGARRNLPQALRRLSSILLPCRRCRVRFFSDSPYVLARAGSSTGVRGRLSTSRKRVSPRLRPINAGLGKVRASLSRPRSPAKPMERNLKFHLWIPTPAPWPRLSRIPVRP